jgi:hypothetical protein
VTWTRFDPTFLGCFSGKRTKDFMTKITARVTTNHRIIWQNSQPLRMGITFTRQHRFPTSASHPHCHHNQTVDSCCRTGRTERFRRRLLCRCSSDEFIAESVCFLRLSDTQHSMPQINPDASDWDKLQQAFQEITEKFGSVNHVLEAFGLANLPVAQRYGILFGCIVFVTTVGAVMALLVFGGTFQRIAEETKTGNTAVESDYRVRLDRPLLLERLLDAQQRLLRENYPSRAQRKEVITNLTKMLSSVPPPKDDCNGDSHGVDFNLQRAEVMVGYKQNFILGYRKCQDKPGGELMCRRNDAMFEV